MLTLFLNFYPFVFSFMFACKKIKVKLADGITGMVVVRIGLGSGSLGRQSKHEFDFYSLSGK